MLCNLDKKWVFIETLSPEKKLPILEPGLRTLPIIGTLKRLHSEIHVEGACFPALDDNQWIKKKQKT